MSETTMTLAYPIQRANGETVAEIAVRRPKVADLRELDRASGDIGRQAVLIGRLCALTPKEVDQLDAGDFSTLGQVVADFLPAAPATGAS